MRLCAEGVKSRGVAFTDDLIKVGGASDIRDDGLGAKDFTDVVKIHPCVQRIPQFFAKFFGMIPHTPIEVGEVRVEIVVDFKFAGQLVKQHPCTAAEHFDIPVARAAESCNNGFAQGFFTAYP